MPRQYTRRAPVHVVGPSIAYIPLTRNQFACVDVEDAVFLGQWTWLANPSHSGFYAMRSQTTTARKHTKVMMARAILGLHSASTGLVDHISGRTLDNRQANLRITDFQGNARNRKVRDDNRSGVKGVTWYARTQRWIVYICVDGKSIFLGYFLDKQEAGNAYQTAARKHFGDFARK